MHVVRSDTNLNIINASMNRKKEEAQTIANTHVSRQIDHQKLKSRKLKIFTVSRTKFQHDKGLQQQTIKKDQSAGASINTDSKEISPYRSKSIG